MEIEPVIGLEVHVQLKTKSKMFCSCPNIFGDVPPNSAICPICLGYPGTLPVPNRQAIAWTQLVGAALNCELARESKFDRKSYFYPDLPKGYQISQYDKPFCRRGSLLGVDITRVHLEEDAAKNTHPPGANYTLVDFNRAGTPLIEIVTEPDIRTPAQAKAFLQELQRIMRALGVSDADMEKGQLRCDANISVREKGSSTLNPKTEVKNLNSFRYVARALAYEVDRQTRAYAELWNGVRYPGQKVPDPLSRPSTRGFDTRTGRTVPQRTKEEAADYRYFPEPDIPPFTFSNDELRQVAIRLPELPRAKSERLQRQFSLAPAQAQLLADIPHLADFFEQTVSELQQLDKEQPAISPREVAPLVLRAVNMILRELRGRPLNRTTPANFAELVVLAHRGAVNPSALPQILDEMERTGGDPDHIIDKLGLGRLDDKENLTASVREVVAAHQDVVAKIKAGKTSALRFLIGQVMAKTRGQANPAVIEELLREEIARR